MKQSLAPGLCAFAARRQIAAFRVETRKTESHRHDRNLHRIVEYLLADPEPLAQADAGRIGEGAPRGVNADARRLAGDAEAGGGRDLESGSRLMGQGSAVSGRIATKPAGANLFGDHLERRIGRFHGRPDYRSGLSQASARIARSARELFPQTVIDEPASKIAPSAGGTIVALTGKRSGVNLGRRGRALDRTARRGRGK